VPLFERRVAHGWWQGLGRNGLPVMEATAEAKRRGKEQGGNNEFTCVHDEIPVLSPAISNTYRTKPRWTDNNNAIFARTVPREKRLMAIM